MTRPTVDLPDGWYELPKAPQIYGAASIPCRWFALVSKTNVVLLEPVGKGLRTDHPDLLAARSEIELADWHAQRARFEDDFIVEHERKWKATVATLIAHHLPANEWEDELELL